MLAGAAGMAGASYIGACLKGPTLPQGRFVVVAGAFFLLELLLELWVMLNEKA
jgi:hypothetical protein